MFDHSKMSVIRSSHLHAVLHTKGFSSVFSLEDQNKRRNGIHYLSHFTDEKRKAFCEIKGVAKTHVQWFGILVWPLLFLLVSLKCDGENTEAINGILLGLLAIVLSTKVGWLLWFFCIFVYLFTSTFSLGPQEPIPL